MARTINMAVLVVVGVLASALLQGTEAVVHTVGGSTGWTNNIPNTTFYANWASQTTFAVGDVLVFTFATGSHDVASGTPTQYTGCTTPNSQNITNTGPASITLNTTGQLYFFCTFPGHCSAGQKLNINVTTTGSASPSPGSSPTTPSTVPSPAPPSSASSLSATFSVIFMSIVMGSSF